ncbi:MAG: PPC domain-containing protein [Sterolibacterium sp.]
MADDFAASVSTTGSVAVRGSTSGQLETVGDRDWFAITLSAGNQYSFKLDPGTTNGLQDPYLRLFSTGGTTKLAENDDANGLGSQIDFNITATGTYYLEAGSGTNPDEQVVGSGMGSYILSATTTGDDYSAVVGTTGRITVGNESVGELEIAGDSDWFAVTLTAGKEYLFTLNSGATDGLTDPLLSLYRSDSSLVTSNDDSDGLNSQITHTAATTGTYYLGASSGMNGNGTGSYALNASLVPPDTTSATDDYSAASSTTGRVVVGGASTGQLEVAGDSDWFAISLTAGKQYVFTLNSGATDGLADPLLSLYRTDGSLVTSNDDDAADGLDSTIAFAATATGTYYLGASSGTNGSGTGSYALNASEAITDDYLATTNTSGRVAPGSSTSGQLETTGDSDWFAVNLTAGQLYAFALDSGTTNGLADPFLGLYNSSGTLITSDDDGNGSNAALSYTATATGTYYLGASSSPRSTGAGTGSYTVSTSLPSVDGVVIVGGTTSADTISSGASDESIDGGLGLDSVVFGGSAGDYAVTPSGSGFAVARTTGGNDTHALTNVERLQFSDGKIALDMAVTQSGGEVALLIGAVLGKASLTDATLVGQLLPFFDAGNTMKNAADALVNSGIMDQLAGGSSTNAYVNMLFLAIVGEAATPDTTAALASLIDSGAYSKADFLATVAELSLNQDNVGLVGLQQTGIAYL